MTTVEQAVAKMEEIKNRRKQNTEGAKPGEVNLSKAKDAISTMEEIASRNKPEPKNNKKIISEVENPNITSAAARMIEIAKRNKLK